MFKQRQILRHRVAEAARKAGDTDLALRLQRYMDRDILVHYARFYGVAV